MTTAATTMDLVHNNEFYRCDADDRHGYIIYKTDGSLWSYTSASHVLLNVDGLVQVGPQVDPGAPLEVPAAVLRQVRTELVAQGRFTWLRTSPAPERSPLRPS